MKLTLLKNYPLISKCVSFCPSGYYADTTLSKCVKCSSKCLECNGPKEQNCTKCDHPNKLIPSMNTCVSQCPNGFFTSNRPSFYLKLIYCSLKLFALKIQTRSVNYAPRTAWRVNSAVSTARHVKMIMKISSP